MRNEFDKFEIVGGNRLYGKIKNQTSKNASLPILAACLLCDEKVTLCNLPKITDVSNMLKLLSGLGVKITKRGNKTILDPTLATNVNLDCDLCKSMRSSLFLLGPILAKFKEVDLTLPGGCQIGKRPIDIHISALEKLGVKVSAFEEYMHFEVDEINYNVNQNTNITPQKNNCSNLIKLKIPSVGATENIIMYACKLKGKTTILNPAREPEIVDLCNFLNKMGAKIIGAGSKKITIYGVNYLHSTKYKPIGDRIIAGTIMCAVAICGGDVEILNAVPKQNSKLIKILRSMGCNVHIKNDILRIVRNKKLKSAKIIKTGFYPKFPTDLQSLLLAVSTISQGKTLVHETVFENRFLTLTELEKFGAEVKQINNHKAQVCGVNKIVGAQVSALDLRGGASLVLMALASEGESTISNVHFIDRGYENLENMLSNLGADIKRV